MSKASYFNEVKDRLVFRLSQEFKNEDLVKSIVDHHFDTLRQKLFPTPLIRTRTKEDLIRLFTLEAPYRLRYKTLGYQREEWKADVFILEDMILEGTVRIADRRRNSILYAYDPQKFQGQ